MHGETKHLDRVSSMQAEADSLGSYLRRERERRQVSLQDISAATKVQLKFLEALERDDYDHLPPAPFVGGFLRAYAQCLALDPDAIIAAYHARHDASEGVEGHRLFVAYQVKRSKRFHRAKVAMAVIVLVLLAGLAWRTLKGGQEVSIPILPPPEVTEQTPGDFQDASEVPRLASDTPSIPPATSPPMAAQVSTASPVDVAQEQSVAPAVAPETSSPPPSETVPSESPAEETPPVESLTPLVLQAIALEDTWLQVDIDGGKRRALLLTAGKSIQWEATERFVLTVGNAQGTRLVLNGHDVPLPPTRTNVVRDFVLTRAMVD
jgi:cytoskeletal protein RodZ